MPIPTFPLLIILNTSLLPLLAVKISSVPPNCVTDIPVPVPILFISNLSVVKTLVSRVVESPSIVKLDVVKSPIILTSPVYVDILTDKFPDSLISVLLPTFTPPNKISDACGILALSRVPLVILSAFIVVILAPVPSILVALILPLTSKLFEYIPLIINLLFTPSAISSADKLAT